MGIWIIYTFLIIWIVLLWILPTKFYVCSLFIWIQSSRLPGGIFTYTWVWVSLPVLSVLLSHLSPSPVVVFCPQNALSTLIPSKLLPSRKGLCLVSCHPHYFQINTHKNWKLRSMSEKEHVHLSSSPASPCLIYFHLHLCFIFMDD